ncbi:MAG: Cation/multidrug efflux pump [uncultured Acetobacteraceae bacterium]|uniref:Cation/multidrug efflux pump n=1 Tax=uncultured Acetobacteraceae bacterium TaxID=169975 RepID=A0A6J4J0L2_9PROT|nr:MAG: Cation/multidrug efflux pump [uncultured Acetobacteraceae bacterium]
MADATGPERLPPRPPEQMTSRQREVAAAISGGPRGGLRGPFQAWLRSPEVADRFQRVGEYVRFGSSIPPALNELAILVTAREWTAQFEWYAHHALAMKAGLPPAIADAIARGERPEGMDADQRAVYDFSTELHRERSVSDAAYAAVVERFGERGVVDLIAACGYYVAVAMTLNVSRVPLPDGVAPPLAPLSRAPGA